MIRDSLQLLLAAAILSGGITPAAGAHGQQITTTALVRGWSSATSQGPWCDQSCILSNAAKLLTPNMSLEVDPFMQITDSVWPTVVTDGWWVPASGSGSAAAAVSIDGFGRPVPHPGRFPGSDTQGLGLLCSALHGLRGTATNAGGLRCGADLVLGVPRSAVAAASPVLGAPHATAATIANRSDPLGSYHFSLNASAQGTAEYVQSLAQVMLAWRVDHVHVSVAGGTWEPRWLPALRAFAVSFNRTAGNKRTLAISGPGGSTDPLLPGSELLNELRGVADSVAAGPPLWDTWAHLCSALILAEQEWGRVSQSSCRDQQPCARWDIGVLPIGRLGAVQGGNMTYPPWHAGSCTPIQLGCGDAAAAIHSPACCPRHSRLSRPESRFVYTLALASNSPLLIGGSLRGLSNSIPSLQRFLVPDEGAYSYSRSPLTSRAMVLKAGMASSSSRSHTIMCRGTSSTTQPRVFDYTWMCFFFNTGNESLSLSLDLSTLPLDATAPGNSTGRDYMLHSLLGAGGPDGAYFGGRRLQIGNPGVGASTETTGDNGTVPALVAHDALAVRVQRVRMGLGARRGW